MTGFLATVASAGEAGLALAGGADLIDIAEDADAAAIVAAVGGRRPVCAPAGAGLATQFIAVEDASATPRDTTGRSRFAATILADGGLDPAAIDAMARRGFAAVRVTARSGRLLDHADIAALGGLRARARAAGLDLWLSGRLEPPDVPRLLALDPACLGFRAALMRNGRMDALAIALIRDLIPRNGIAARATAASGPLDKLIVRDLILPVRIGAYEQERGREQRVRFEVVAEVRRAPNLPRDIRDVFSYDIILDAIRACVAEGHVDLLETLGERIAARLLRHAEVARVTLRLEKLDLGPAIAGIEIVREASGVPGSG